MEEIKDNDILLARIIRKTEIKEGLSFFSEENEFIQVGTWNYNEGKESKAHIHNEVERKAMKTNEVWYIISGSLLVWLYHEKNEFVRGEFLSEGDMIILLNGGHQYYIREDNTKVLEVKNGPYLGPTVDRRQFR